MKPTQTIHLRRVLICCVLAIFVLPCLAQSPSTPPSAPTKGAASKTTASAGASDSQIAAAKASGQVWVNLESGIYHKGGRWYGKTKNGKFMTEDEARKAGYKAAQRN